MSFRVGVLKNGWVLFRNHDTYHPPLAVSRGLSVYNLYRDLISIDCVFDATTADVSSTINSKSGILYSMLITIDLADISPDFLPVKFETGELFEHTLPGIAHNVRKQPFVGFPRKNDIIVPFANYEELVKNYSSLEHFVEWKKYEAAKRRFDRTGVQDFTVSGECLLFPCERDLRKLIRDEEGRLRILL